MPDLGILNVEGRRWGLDDGELPHRGRSCCRRWEKGWRMPIGGQSQCQQGRWGPDDGEQPMQGVLDIGGGRGRANDGELPHTEFLNVGGTRGGTENTQQVFSMSRGQCGARAENNPICSQYRGRKRGRRTPGMAFSMSREGRGGPNDRERPIQDILNIAGEKRRRTSRMGTFSTSEGGRGRQRRVK